MGLHPRVLDYFTRSYGNKLDKKKIYWKREKKSVSVFETALSVSRHCADCIMLQMFQRKHFFIRNS